MGSLLASFTSHEWHRPKHSNFATKLPLIGHVTFLILTLVAFTTLMLMPLFTTSSYNPLFVVTLPPSPSYYNKLNVSSTTSLTSTSTSTQWLKIAPPSNYSDTYLALISNNGSKACHNVPTTRVHIVGLSPTPTMDGDTYVNLSCGIQHEFLLVSFDEHGERRCYGGDYFETLLYGPNWRARAPINDLGDGSYSLSLQVHPRFEGVYQFKVILGFSNYHGLHRRPERWFRNETMIDLTIHFQSMHYRHQEAGQALVPQLAECKARDFQLDGWVGRWTRPKHSSNDCKVNAKGRFMCMNLNEKCEDPWCRGPVGRLESNGWVYSTHCSFRIFTHDQAWRCLNKKWLFFWGDSNHVDTIRNLLNFALGFDNVTSVPRRFDTTYFRPSNPSQYVRITSMFNGHSNVSLNHQGLFSLNNSAFRDELTTFFNEKSPPDVIVMNSGLHDGIFWKHIHEFVEQGVNRAVEFWASLLTQINGRIKPRVIYRNTITTATWARAAGFNPQKMEVFNYMFVEKLKKSQLLWGVVDGFDLTYAWHYDNNCSDGVHYGKPPARGKWYGNVGHHYFVDLMLVHILLHAICID